MNTDASTTRPKAKRRRKYAPPLSLHPLVAEEALSALLQVKPRKKAGKKPSWPNPTVETAAKPVVSTLPKRALNE